MTTEFLKSIGITDSEIISKIFAEHGKDINAIKGEKESLETKVSELDSKISNLETDIQNRDEQLKDLKKNNKDNDELTKRIEELESENQTNKENYEIALKNIKRDNAVNHELKDTYGVKNIKAISPFIDFEKVTFDENSDKISGLDEQIKPLMDGEDTEFLFNKNDEQGPSGTHLNNPNNQKHVNGNSQTQSEFTKALAAQFGQ